MVESGGERTDTQNVWRILCPRIYEQGTAEEVWASLSDKFQGVLDRYDRYDRYGVSRNET